MNTLNVSCYKTAQELAAYLDGLYEVNDDGSFTGRKWDVAQRAAIAVMGVTPPWIDAKALEVAKRFTQDTETQRRASLQIAVSEAMRQAALAPPSGEGVAIYQCMCTDDDALRNGPKDVWMDVDAQSYESLRKRGDMRSRIVYTTPQSAPVDGVPAWPKFVQNEVLECLRNMDTQLRATGQYSARIERAINMLEGMPPASQERGDRQRVVHDWCVAAFGDDHAKSIEQRGIRLVEEAIEAGQACGCDPAMVHRLVDHVYSKPAGQLFQEMGGVGVTLLALAEAAGLDADNAEQTEIKRVLSKPLEHFAARNAAKNAAGFNVLASPPSSAAEHRLEMFTKSPGLHEDGCPLSGTPNLYASCDCGLGAAEQAKPDDNMQLRARVAGELIAARDTEDGCNRIMALIATLDTYTAQTECVAAMYPAEQAQAWEVWRYIWNPMGMIARDHKQFAESDTTEYVTLADYNALRSRLAGGVTVDYPMVHLALNAQPYLDKNDEMRVWQLFKDGVDSETAMRAALVAALGAK